MAHVITKFCQQFQNTFNIVKWSILVVNSMILTMVKIESTLCVFPNSSKLGYGYESFETTRSNKHISHALLNHYNCTSVPKKCLVQF
jgi:hypothetical protein